MKTVVVFIFFINYIYAINFIESIYKRAYSDTLLSFTSHNIHFRCKIAGIKTVKDVLNDSKTSKKCRMKLIEYLKRNPLQNFFPQMILHEYQTYHVEPIGDIFCKVMLNAGKSYAQKLIELGYAKIDEKQKLDRNYFLALRRSQKFAQDEKVGIWQKTIYQDCLR